MHDCLNLRWTTIESIELLITAHAPDLVLPSTFGGHLVGTDAVADLAFTLGWLAEAGVHDIAGTPIEEAIRRVLQQVDGPETHSFFSYRVAETLARFGPFEDNRILANLTDAEVDNLREACDSTALVDLLDALPRNYVAVLARCELARERLGLLDDRKLLDDLVDRTRTLIAGNPRGYLDDSQDGSDRFDIYTADLYLFCEPMADVLGDAWTSGTRQAIDLVEKIVATDGSAFAWGRSTGVLSRALTLELAALAVQRGLTDDPAAWLSLAARAATGLRSWFDPSGVITAHRHISTEAYRGPQRRLQMTFDVLGKLAEAALRLGHVAEPPAVLSLPHRDDLVGLSDRASVWTFRDDRLAFVMPFVGGRSSDYVSAPRHPGVFGSPVDSELACFVPIAHTPGSAISPQQRFVPAETPAHVRRSPAGVEVAHDRFVATRSIDSTVSPKEIDATRVASYRVGDGAIEVDERLRFEEPPAAVSILVPEFDRPLRVVASGAGARLVRTEVEGMKEWAGAWASARAVVEIEVEPAPEMSFRWSVEPKPLVSVTVNEHHYVRTIYDPISDPLTGRVAERRWARATDAGDVVHLHWPEWCFGPTASLDEHHAIGAALRKRGTSVAWTQHNLTPHLDQPDVYDPIYQAWADQCDLAIHHSDWGRERVLARYRFTDDCTHVVIPHPHFGPVLTGNEGVPRDEAASLLGLGGRPTPAIRIGVIGAPRKDKDLALLIDAVTASARTDIELVVWSLGFLDAVPNDPRILADYYHGVDRATFDLRIAACDVIALPFTGHSMLATGTASDLVATGTPALISDWPYLTEHLGEGGIRAGQTVDSWTAAIDALDPETLAIASAEMVRRQALYDPTLVANATADALVSLGLRSV